MKVIGIVAEYNPLHNGHVYQIEYAKKELQADAIVVVLAGDFLQRGLPAVMERTVRAKAAVDAGADVVFEMPTVVATSSANDYALGSIALLHHCGVVTDLLFGCENGSDDDFLRAAKAIEELEGTDAFSDAINEYKSKGCSFAEARAKAICKMKPELSEEFLSAPNNTLGIEYVRALLHFKSDIVPHALPRIGAQHGSNGATGAYASASFIRDSIAKGDDVATFVPEA
ncbi:MAG: nucleotidyltransferase family protein, partial [Lachnospiraceae bacterium]|nr:nucleotidyltransferase family protein [Lachnospiraceae bacterium]